MIPNNPFEKSLRSEPMTEGQAVMNAVLALAYEQRQRNRLAAITARSKALSLPSDLEDLATEGEAP